jgi:hypothetical protein
MIGCQAAEGCCWECEEELGSRLGARWRTGGRARLRKRLGVEMRQEKMHAHNKIQNKCVRVSCEVLAHKKKKNKEVIVKNVKLTQQ